MALDQYSPDGRDRVFGAPRCARHANAETRIKWTADDRGWLAEFYCSSCDGYLGAAHRRIDRNALLDA